MRTTTSRHLTTAGALIVLTGLVAGCTADAGATNPATTVDIVTGDRPDTDVVALAAGASDADVQAAIDAAVERIPSLAKEALEESGVPGMAIAVVHGGEMIYSGGFGVKTVGEDDAIDPETVFQIASISKSISATTIAKAVTDGAISWDTPVIDELPGFALADPYVTQNATVGDYFSHRTGLSTGGGDILEDIGYDRDYVLAHLHLQPLHPFRSSYNYSNYGITVGAEATAAALGLSWADAVDQLVYEPIGMASSGTLHSDFIAHENRAPLHTLIDGEFKQLFDRQPDPQAPAAGVSSTVIDLAKWMNVVLAEGALDGDDYIDSDALGAATTGQMILSTSLDPSARNGMYGYGFNVGTQPGGRVAISHSGGFVLGTGTNFQVVPSLDFGIVTLTNGAPVGVAEAVNAEVLDLVQFGQIKRDWISDYRGAIGGLNNPEGDLVDETPPELSSAAVNREDFVGSYTNDYFGALTISLQGETLVAALGPDGGYTLDLTPWDTDIFSFVPTGENAPYDSLSSARFDRTAGSVSGVTMDFFDHQGLGSWQKVTN